MAYSDLYGKLTDEQLLLLIKKGNRGAFTQFYERYNKLVYAVSYKYLMNREQAEDTVQYVFIRIWEYRSDLQYGLSLKNYLYTLAKNYVLNVIRNENTAFEKNCEMAQTAPEYEDNLVETIEKKELLDNLYHAINQLPDRYKEICLMKIKENMSNKEIAERMNLSINTIKTHYSEALRLLRLSFSRMLIFIFVLILFSYLSVYLTK